MRTTHEGLQDFVRPAHYALSLRDLNLERWTYSGTVVIGLNTAQTTRELILNVHEIEVQSSILTITKPHPASLRSSDITIDTDDETVTLAFNQEIPASPNLELTVEFTAKINDSLSGFYRIESSSRGGPNGSGDVMLCTHFEPTGARRAFPCFDDPIIKTAFELTIEIPGGLAALSNMPVKHTKLHDEKPGTQVIAFETTPVMSTYILAWGIGKFEHIERETERRRIPVRIYTAPGMSEQGRWALEHAVKCIDLFSEVFEIDYPLPKCDFLAINASSFSAMENWGLITVKKQMLLFDPQTSDPSFKKSIPSTIAHELAHQWFGNLVTLEWWDMLWLNESFATWAGEMALDRIHPDWNVWLRFIAEDMESAFRLDGLRTSHPIHVEVDRGRDAAEVFDSISYNKGCSVIRMLERHIGVDVFLKGVARYLKNRAYGCAKTNHLWEALETVSGQDIRIIMDVWLSKVGYPILEVSEQTPGTLVLRQSRFLTSGDVKAEEDDTNWWLPLGLRCGNNTNINTVMKARALTITDVDTDFYILNSGATGFYRVKYTDARLQKLGQQMDRLGTSDKLALLNSQTALAFAGSSTIASLLAFIESLAGERDVLFWQQIVTTIDSVLSTFDEDEETTKGLARFALKISKSGLDIFGRERREGEGDDVSEVRMQLLELAGANGDEKTVYDALNTFSDWRDSGNPIDPAQRPMVFSIAARHMPREAFKALRNEWQHGSAPDSKLLALYGMSHTSDAEVVRDLVLPFNYGTEPAGMVVAAADMHTIGSGLGSSAQSRRLLWEHLKLHWDAVLDKIKNPMLVNRTLRGALSRFSSVAVAEEIRQFMAQKCEDVAAHEKTMETVVGMICVRAARRDRDTEPLRSWLGEAHYL